MKPGPIRFSLSPPGQRANQGSGDGAGGHHTHRSADSWEHRASVRSQASSRTLPARTPEPSAGAASVPFLQISLPVRPTLRQGPTKPSGRGGLVSTSPSRPGPLNTARPWTLSEQRSNPASQDIPALSTDITLTLIRQINTAFEDQRHRATVYYIKLSVKGERKDRLGLFSPWQLRKKKKEERGVWREVISRCLKRRWCCLDGVCDGERQAWVRGLPPPPLAPRTRAGCPPETQPLLEPTGHSPIGWGG